MNRARMSAQHQEQSHGASRSGPHAREDKSADPLQRDVTQLQATAGNAAVTAALGSGLPVAPDVRAHMEARFGESFKDVRIHDDTRAHATAAALGSKAFTHGSDIGFAAGRFAPHSINGKRLLAHELAHVVQQRRGTGGQPTLEQQASLEQDAAGAADSMANGVAPILVDGASAPAVMLDPVDDYEAEQKRERREQRRRKRKADRERAQERAGAGKSERQKAAELAERDLRKMETHVQKMGGNQRSPSRRSKKFDKVERLLESTRGSTLEKNLRKSAFDERQRTGSKAKAQGEYVRGGEKLPDQQLTDEFGRRASHARPDYSVYRRMPDGSLKRVHVNLKSHRIHKMSASKARGASREILYQAVGNKAHLPAGEKLIIDFSRVPSLEVQEAIKNELFRENTPIDEVRFGPEVHSATDYKPEGGRQPLDTDADDRRRRLRREKQAKKEADAARKKLEADRKKVEAARDRQGAAAEKKAKAAEKKAKASEEKKAGKDKKAAGKGKTGNQSGKPEPAAKKAEPAAKDESKAPTKAPSAPEPAAKKVKPPAKGKTKVPTKAPSTPEPAAKKIKPPAKGKAKAPTKASSASEPTKQPVEAAGTAKAAATEAKPQATERSKPALPEKPVITESAPAPSPVEAPKAAPVAPAEVHAPVAEPTVTKPAAPVSEPKPSVARGAASTALGAAAALGALPAVRDIGNDISEGNWLEATTKTAELGASFVPQLAPVFFAKGMITEYWGPEHEAIQGRANTVGDAFKEAAEYTPLGLVPYAPEVVGGLGAASWAVLETGGRTAYNIGEAVYEGGEMVVEGAEAAYDWLTEPVALGPEYEAWLRHIEGEE